MAAQVKATSQVKFTTIIVENSETVELDLFATVPDQAEVFIKTLVPGEVSVQLSPVGAVWSLRPKVSERKYTVREGGNSFRSTEIPEPPKPRSERGGASITSTSLPPDKKP